MRPLKIALIGAGSASFGLRTIADICRFDELLAAHADLLPQFPR